MNPRIGFGFDAHQLKEGRPLILGGVQIPGEKGVVAHSDGDVIVHAIIDALLGAANLRDIGYHFPENDVNKGASSLDLLKQAYLMVKEAGFSIANIDSTIVLQDPRLSGFIENMKSCISEALKIKKDQISIKATTTDLLGFEGRKEGLSAYAVIMLV